MDERSGRRAGAARTRVVNASSFARGLLAAGALALAALSSACDRPASAGEGTTLERGAKDAWQGPRLAAFELFERDGRKVTRDDLAGTTLVMDFVFTTCAGPCPALSAGMFDLQEQLVDTDVRLVTVSVDPLNDTPEVLAAYADKLGADPERWLFLRGTEEQLQALMASVNLAVVRNSAAAPGFEVTHSTRLLVVDGEGLVRGYYPGTNEAGLTLAAQRARWLDGR